MGNDQLSAQISKTVKTSHYTHQTIPQFIRKVVANLEKIGKAELLQTGTRETLDGTKARNDTNHSLVTCSKNVS
jgi:hypothetical protein